MSEVVSNKTVDDIVEEINQFDINDVQLDPGALEYFKTVEAYLDCYDKLQALYEEVDPGHKLANYDMDDIKEPIQQLSTSGEPVKNIVELYDVAESMFPVYVDKIVGLIEEVSAVSDSEDSSCHVEFMLPPGDKKLKATERAAEKAKDDYSKIVPGPGESWLYDIVRGSVLFDTAEPLFRFLELLREDKSIRIVKSKNRFRKPTLSGYRDFCLQIQIEGDNGMKHICEIQLHIEAIKTTAKELHSHHFYEFFRKFYAGSTDSLEETMDDFRVICKGGSLDMEFLAGVIQNPLAVSHMTRLSDLFADDMNEYQLAIMITTACRDELEPALYCQKLGVWLDLQGKYEESLTMHREALDISLKLHGPNHEYVATAYNGIANVLCDQGQFKEAKPMYQKALDIRLKVHGPNHSKTAAIYNNMAAVLWEQGELEEAMAMYQKTSDIDLKLHGPCHQDTAHTYHNIALVLQDQGKHEEAMTILNMALGIYLRIYGPNHTDTASIYAMVGYGLFQQDRLEEALVESHKALGIQETVLGEHVDTGGTLSTIGEILLKQGKLEEARQIAERAWNIADGIDPILMEDVTKLLELIDGKASNQKVAKRRSSRFSTIVRFS